MGESYAADRRISVSRVGFLAASDGKFFTRLAAGGTCTIRTARGVVRWFSNHWPPGLEWPPDVPRPEPSPASSDEAKEAA